MTIAEALQRGETVRIRPRGHSMRPDDPLVVDPFGIPTSNHAESAWRPLFGASLPRAYDGDILALHCAPSHPDAALMELAGYMWYPVYSFLKLSSHTRVENHV